jgi:hypothetical protein
MYRYMYANYWGYFELKNRGGMTAGDIPFPFPSIHSDDDE